LVVVSLNQTKKVVEKVHAKGTFAASPRRRMSPPARADAARGPNTTLIPCDGPPGFDPDELSARGTWTQVGDGSFGKVFRGELLGEPVAIKVTANARPDRIAGLKRDLWYLSSFSHPNITRVYGGFIEDGDAHMVMEFIPHSLRSKRVVNETNRVKVLADVARALVRVHAMGHVHRDVKARNVLVTEVRD
jgi:serine/threonine-protein kinase 24/25/MST4